MQALNFNTVDEARKYMEANNPLGMVLFTDQDKVSELSKVANDNVILCSSAGEYGKNGFTEHSIVGFSFDIIKANIIEIKTPAIRSLRSLQAGYEKVKDNSNAFLFLLCNGLSMGEESILSTLFFMKNDFKIIGGSAGDYCAFDETKIYIGKKQVDSVGIFFDMDKRTQLLKENIYHSTGKKLLVTKANPIKRTIYELNNKKAADEYARALGIEKELLADNFIHHPIGRIVQDNTYIASPMKVNPDLSITFYSQILPNTFVDILEPSDSTSCFEETMNQLIFKPGFVLSVHCILRCLKFKEENTWDILNEKLLSVTDNQAGFISYGEQYFKRHINQSMTILAVEQ